MKKSSLAIAALWVVLLVVGQGIAQESGEVVAVDASAPRSGGLMNVILSGGVVGILNWAGIFLWGILAFPLGILSAVHCATLRVRQYPLATKLLLVGGVWLFVLGWVGAAQGIIGAFSALACGAADAAVLAMGISQALYSVAAALFVCQHYLFFILISVAIAHFKYRKLLDVSVT